MTQAPRRPRWVWKLPLSARDAKDLKDINHRLERLRAIERALLRLRHFILQRGRTAYRLQQGWRPLPHTRLTEQERKNG
jgi:hypothetical protein